MKKTAKNNPLFWPALFLVWVLVLSQCLPLGGALARAEEEPQALSSKIDQNRISKHGNLHLYLTREDMAKAGYALGDVVTLSFLDRVLDLPYVSSYSDVESGQPGLFAVPANENISLAINMGDFATTYGFAVKITHADNSYEWQLQEGVEAPVTFTITLKEKEGYLAEYTIRHLSYTNERADYPHLSDEAFANFRELRLGKLGAHTLYRSASPIDNSRGRADFADAAFEKHGISVVMNLFENTAGMQELEGYQDRYYAGTKVIGLNAGIDFMAEDFREKLRNGLVFFADNPGIYALHCLEGKDRTGFVTAVLACFMGASLDAVVEDYMLSFFNYFGVEKGSEKYDIIAQSNILASLRKAFDTDNLEEADLEALAHSYLTGIGLSPETLETLANNLSADHHNFGEGVVTKEATEEEEGLMTYSCSICGEIRTEPIPKLEPQTEPATEAATEPETEAETEPETEPATDAATEPATASETPEEAITEAATEVTIKTATEAAPETETAAPPPTEATRASSPEQTAAPTPEMGDGSSLALWVILLLGAAGGIGCLGKRRKKA